MSVLALDSAAGRRTLAASIVGSGAAFLEGTVVNVALPSIARDLGLGLEGVQWVINAYLLALGALTLLGGALGDRYGRRRLFVAGAIGFSVITAGCAIAPGRQVLLVLRFSQGRPARCSCQQPGDARGVVRRRGPGHGHWPLGWLVRDIDGDRAVARRMAHRRGVVALGVRGDRARRARGGVARVRQKCGERPPWRPAHRLRGCRADGPRSWWRDRGADRRAAPRVWSPRDRRHARGRRDPVGRFAVVERRSESPLLPPALFRSRAFTGANLATVLLYAALGGVLLLLMLQLQGNLGYSALQSGASLLPANVLMLALSPAAGRFAHRHGARSPMTSAHSSRALVCCCSRASFRGRPTSGRSCRRWWCSVWDSRCSWRRSPRRCSPRRRTATPAWRPA